MQSWKLQALALLSGAWQFRFYGLVAAWLVCIAGWVGVALIPSSYESAAIVYIDTDTLLVPLLKGLAVNIDPQQQISVMLHTLLTAPNIETVIRATNGKAQSMTRVQMQDAIADLQQNVSLKNVGAKNLFAISYTDVNPSRAQQVAQALVGVLVDSNIGNRRRDADDVRVFLDNQIADYERKLREADSRRAAFKAAHLDIFTGQAGDIVGAKTAVTAAQTAYDEDVQRRNSMRAQLAATSPTENVSAPSPLVIGSNAPTNRRSELASARARLDDLRAHYTDDFPDVIATKKLIARLEADLADKSAANDGEETQGISNPAYVMLREKLADLDAAVAVDIARLADAQKHLDDAKNVAVTALTVERQYEDLDRDYKVLHDNYESLVERRESASISQAAGDEQSSVVFRVVEPARRPDRPVAPDRIIFNIVVLLAGLASGGGVAFLLSQFSGRFMTVDQLSKTFSLPSLGAITVVRTARDMAAARRSVAFFVACTGLLLASYMIVLFFFHTNVAVAGGVA